MTPLPPQDQRFLKAFFQSVADEPLAPNDHRYTVLHEGNQDPVKLLATSIRFSRGQSVQLFSGYRGTGKTTELHRLDSSLTTEGYLVVYIDLDQYLNMSMPVDIGDFLMSIAGAFGESLARPELLGESSMHESYWERLRAFLTNTQVGFPEASAMDIKVNLKTDPSFKRYLQERLAGSVSGLVADVRKFLAECLLQLRKRHGPDTEVVLLIDSIEHIRGTYVNTTVVQESMTALFTAHVEMLRLPYMHVVYTAPPYLTALTPNLGALYGSGAIQTLPAIAVRNYDGTSNDTGRQALKTLLMRRGDLHRLLGSDERNLDQLILASGGNLRDLLRLVGEVIRRATQCPVDEEVVRDTINGMRMEFLPISNEDAVWLARIAKTHQAEFDDIGEVATLARFLDSHLVLAYRNGNAWYDVHPLVRGVVLPQAAQVERQSRAIYDVMDDKRSPAAKFVDPTALTLGLRSLHLSHIRLFKDISFDFCRNGSPRPFTLILAENGHGKTTVLQAIALAASGIAGANLLAGNAAAFLDRRIQSADEKEVCRIRAHFNEFDSELYAPPSWKEFAGTPSLLDQVRAKDIPQWFVAGYGTGRMLPRARTSKEPGRRAVDRLRSLFDAEPLVATGFADILADLLGRSVAADYAETLHTILVGRGNTPGLLPHDEQLRVEALELRGSGAIRGSTDLVDADRFVLRLGEHHLNLPAAWLSAGYQSTVAWVADLLGQVTLEVGRVLPPEEIRGIVLIDEIDLHLHPQWQASLISSLRALFPQVQFFATTHSPMVLPALRQDEIVLLSLDTRGNIQQRPAPVAPALKTGSEILEWFFGIDQLYPAELGQVLQEYTNLASDSERTDDDDTHMNQLREKLREFDADPGWEPVGRSHGSNEP